jgi:hypothetical protein
VCREKILVSFRVPRAKKFENHWFKGSLDSFFYGIVKKGSTILSSIKEHVDAKKDTKF